MATWCGAAPCSVDKWCSASQRLWHPQHPTNNNVQSSLWATFSLKYQEQQILSVLSKITSLSMLQTIQLFLKIITWVLNIQFNQRYSLPGNKKNIFPSSKFFATLFQNGDSNDSDSCATWILLLKGQPQYVTTNNVQSSSELTQSFQTFLHHVENCHSRVDLYPILCSPKFDTLVI